MSEHTSSPTPPVFTEAELQHLQAEDFSAGRAVVIEMVGIFSLGVIIYSIVAWSIMM